MALPGLLDDPQFQITDLPHPSIAPLRNPIPSRNLNVPSPLEPIANNEISVRARSSAAKHNESRRSKTTSKAHPSEIISARDPKKPSLAISELVEAQHDRETQLVQLPSFISLAIVEKSPVPQVQSLNGVRAHKRLRLDLELDPTTNDDYRHLPFPSHKDSKNAGRTAPLLPAMVTGLHEPPPTAALLPSMDLEAYSRGSHPTSSKVDVEALLQKPEKRKQGRPPEQMLNSPIVSPTSLPRNAIPIVPPQSPQVTKLRSPLDAPKGQEDKNKTRRTPRKWTDEETEQLMVGVQKHGIGKWKQILADPAHKFEGRSTVDLKDRFRVKRPTEYRDRELNIDRMRAYSSVVEKATVKHAIDFVSSRSARPEEPSPSSSKDYPTAATSSSLESPLDLVDDNAPLHDSNGRRRKRRPWTATEDEDLLKGVAKHGFQWTLIHDDLELSLSHRKATDLRDRIRNMFPDGYRNADTAPVRTVLRSGTTNISSARPVSASMRVKGPNGGGNVGTNDSLAKHDHGNNTGEPGQEQHGLTLPPLAMNGDDDWDLTLPPLLDWEDPEGMAL